MDAFHRMAEPLLKHEILAWVQSAEEDFLRTLLQAESCFSLPLQDTETKAASRLGGLGQKNVASLDKMPAEKPSWRHVTRTSVRDMPAAQTPLNTPLLRTSRRPDDGAKAGDVDGCAVNETQVS